MTIRTTQRTVTFTRPFRLGESCDQFPPGRYSIETDEELLGDVSFPAYVRKATMMHLIADPRRPGITEVVMIDPRHLDAAIAADTPTDGEQRLDSAGQPEEDLDGPNLTKVPS